LRHFGTFTGNVAWNSAWRRLVTLACLLAFVCVTVAHASHHISPLGEKPAISALAAPHDGADDNDAAAADAICLFCALAATEMTSGDVVLRARGGNRVETSVPALTTRSIPAEFPPPIA
jgi:hypothetical protein